VPVPPPHERIHSANRFRASPTPSRRVENLSETDDSLRTRIFGELPAEILGRGSFGTVFSSANPGICVKCFKTIEDYNAEYQAARYLLQLPKWPLNLVKICRPQKFDIPETICGETYVGFMQMERLGHDLNQIRHITLPQTDQVFRDIGAALCALSEIGLVHTDVKTQNTLCYNSGNVLRMKLGDVAGVTMISLCRWKKVRGTAACNSPSMLLNFRNHRRETIPAGLRPIVYALRDEFCPTDNSFLMVEDMWQFGIMLLEMRSPEFREANAGRIGWWGRYAEAIQQGQEEEHLLGQFIELANCERHVKNLIHEMLNFFPRDRLQFSTLRLHLQRMHIE